MIKFWKNRSETKEDIPWDYERYRDEAQRILDVSYGIMNSTKWRLEKQSAIGEVFSGVSPGKMKIYRVKGIIKVAPRKLIEILFDNPLAWPSWNPVIVESLLLEQVDARTHVTYQVTSEQLGGLVARRDFVELSRWTERPDGALLLASASVGHPRAPAPHSYIRGENRPGCYVIRPVSGGRDAADVDWYLDTSLRGWMPQYLLDAAFASIMMGNLKNLKTHAESA